MPQKRKSGHSNIDDFVVPDDTDLNGSDSHATKKSKRNGETTKSPHFSTPTVPTQSKRDSEGNIYWEISKARRVVISDFKGKKMVSVREYYEKDGQWLPGKKGISMTLEQYGALVEVLPAIERELKRSGVEELPRPRYGEKDAVEVVKEEEGLEEEGEQTEESGDEDNRTSAKANHEATSDEEE